MTIDQQNLPVSKSVEYARDFVCEEEPHMLDLTLTGGYMPVRLGSLVHNVPVSEQVAKVQNSHGE